MKNPTTLLELLLPRDVNPDPSTSPPHPSSTEYCDLKALGLLPPDYPMPDRGPIVSRTVWAFLAFSTVFIALRVYCKKWRSRGLWWDDYVLIVSWLMLIICAVLCQLAVDLGFGRYPCDIAPENHPIIALGGATLGTCISILAVAWSKTSFAITILRLSPSGSMLEKTAWFVLISMNALMTTQAVVVWVKCTPIRKNWDLATEGSCWDVNATNNYGVFCGVYSGLCDILLALLPWKLLWKLQMRKKEKLGVVVCMSMGIVAGVWAFIKSSKLLLLGSKNFTYYLDEGSLLVIWTSAETGTTIMASCIPVLRVLFKELHNTHVEKLNSKETAESMKSDQGSDWPYPHGHPTV
ncbi:hypothetical protein QBC40DRAFT_303418 [Triangularia verruculosa]|uniref:Rhodopsin domain-containing protein n=1 Tax=Triangularia verruculosa TaxID=2587418 RepID=A0AAN6XQ98_9PEZI|nr:hypothetical protein QBC40DRAFT_303418 [Triangularia verruculosa]